MKARLALFLVFTWIAATFIAYLWQFIDMLSPLLALMRLK